ncbi:MAG TPA: nucleotidyltransferase domain-containing protein [Desulfobacterales bacterium]|nr:nucleotidyltransferase domain-containing protein [Desulfobacterales bacterium]
MFGKESLINERVESLFAKQGVVFAYLFGSQVSQKVGDLSDIDIAVYFDDSLLKSEMFNRKLKIMAELSMLLKRDDVDMVIILNEAYPLFAHRIVKYGKVIFSTDDRKRIDF